MRRAQLAMVKGGGEEAPCDLCARGLFLGDGRDESVQAGMLAFLEQARAVNSIRVCGAHREDLAAMDVELYSPVAEVKPARRQRRATEAIVRRTHRASLPRKRPAPPKPQGGGGGVEF